MYRENPENCVNPMILKEVDQMALVIRRETVGRVDGPVAGYKVG
jgi:hypothetical protein